ncbi:MAG: DUF1848 domain-containing protein [Deltaproteobacteria bacterium]|nr:DUF1848 domain-containing protein [Deltaproteobacteria bacterium]
MIISASRRTDIPGFYSEWFMQRIRAGYCVVPNPVNRDQIMYISLKPEDVQIIVFWTRHPTPLLPYLAELTDRGFKYYFLQTILNYPRELEAQTPPLPVSLKSFRALSEMIGPERVIWRYDPLVFSNKTTAKFHQLSFEFIAQALKGYTRRAMISIVDFYAKAKPRMTALADRGIDIIPCDRDPGGWFADLMSSLAKTAVDHDIQLVSCAEEIDLQPYGIPPGKCIDDKYINQVFKLPVTNKKDPSQRRACGCVASRDVGMYDSCLFGCCYCYATKNFDLARANHRQHRPDSPSLLGWVDAKPTGKPAAAFFEPQPRSKPQQLSFPFELGKEDQEN